jgi:multidrug efflux pump subunit AcrA (membrane-fusion protein)
VAQPRDHIARIADPSAKYVRATTFGRRRMGFGVPLAMALTGGVFLCALAHLPGQSHLTPETFFNSGETNFEVAHVRRGELFKTFAAEGDLESASNVEVACRVPGGSMILWVIPDGTPVNKGDVLVRLDPSAIEDRISRRKIAVANARAAQITAERERAAAALSLAEYLSGTFIAQQKQCDANLAVAQQNLIAAEHALKSDARLARRGFITPLQRQADAFNVERARHTLALAQRAKTVLVEYNRPKLLTELECRRDKAEAACRTARAKRALDERKLRRYEKQLALCTIVAPQSGMAIHFNDPESRSSIQDAPQIEEGAVVHEQQVILRLPDLERMQAKLVFHESLVDDIHPGLPARLTVHGREYTGVVDRVTNQPEPSRRSEAHIKRFAAFVRIEERCEGLRPGETAEVELLVDHRRDVLTVPVSAVLEQGRACYAWVVSSEGPLRCKIALGMVTNEQAEIRRGVLEGDAVVLHPRDVLEEANRDAAPEPIDIAKRFGLRQ